MHKVSDTIVIISKFKLCASCRIVLAASREDGDSKAHQRPLAYTFRHCMWVAAEASWKPLLIWGWLSVKDIYLIHFVKNINSAVFHYERLMHICTQDEKTRSTFKSVMFHCWDLNEVVHDIMMMCDWFTDTRIKALKMIINLFFSSSFSPASLILLSVLVGME